MKKTEKLFLDYASDHDLNPSEEEILSFLIESHDKGEQLSIRRAADQLFVSTTSIIRLCKKLGFSGYSEFIFNLGLKVKNMQDPGPATSLHDPLVRKKEEFLSNARWTLDSIGEDSIGKFLDELKQHNLIYFYGAGFSTLFSNYLAKKLELYGYYVSNTSTSDSRAIFFNNIQRYNLLIIFSRSGETAKVIEKVQIAKDKGLKTVLFTGNRQSTTAALADIVFPVFDPTIESQQEFQVTSYESNMFMLIDILLSLAIEQGIIEEY
ncbi:MurR/RpiR family transcriptional regulator [Rossellomorea marisflavi]|uniref:MurR/RpiR family transcriptional regulator n=1 Tax=Rossellomorea TaxID=2837508 RepID=UPI00064F3040|nr:MurR/RpiR family transcriptional regulator [Rossellomorea marisflavi]KML08508.1 RpiR family transcriptional regulator [Rossellomorea marisflavi]QHA38139.1 SIS domain-containing protein [Rossellomorea marisflavi]TYO74120.1 MurR/RpiR family transcriptional regulator [Rossellomorea marisflavi]USK92062.1 MurR/RpiR family transcriptional regulator [Rossellomorea marisflavi]